MNHIYLLINVPHFSLYCRRVWKEIVRRYLSNNPKKNHRPIAVTRSISISPSLYNIWRFHFRFFDSVGLSFIVAVIEAGIHSTQTIYTFFSVDDCYTNLFSNIFVLFISFFSIFQKSYILFLTWAYQRKVIIFYCWRVGILFRKLGKIYFYYLYDYFIIFCCYC